MAAITIRRNVFLLPIKPLSSIQGFYHKLAEATADIKLRPPPSEDDYLVFKQGDIDVSKWKKVDSRSLGITPMMVPASSYTVLSILRSRGFEAYLVGGCVRDLILKRTPKDFDVITTADLDQISKQFHQCQVVGQRFPVCRVFIKGSVVEVSSFDTLAKDAEGKEKFLESQIPKGCDKLDVIRWKNSMHRDFTVNSLFLDLFLQKIYDYNDGMKDLQELKLRTVVPAQLSFTEDLARILRGLRIAARLGLSLSKEIKSAIYKHSSSISRLNQFRIMMELDYMLSFGAAETSFSLLHKYHLLDILLPFQAAYISQQATRSGQSSMMLMKLLSHLDKLVSCDRPCGSNLWIGLLGFHLALATNPQHPYIILTFASVLYHHNWEDGLKYAREISQRKTLVSFNPETLEPCKILSDDEIAEKVNQLATLVVNCIDVLVGIESAHNIMEMFPNFSYSGLVSIPKIKGQYSKQLFDVLKFKVETYNKGRNCFNTNYKLLKKDDPEETRFALGKIILNTMGCRTGLDFDRGSDPNHPIEVINSTPENEYIINKKEDRKQPPLPPKTKNVIATLSSIMQQRTKKTEYKVQDTKHTIQPDLDFDRGSVPIEVINSSPVNEYIDNKKEGRKQPPLPPKTKDMIATLSSIGQQRPKKIEYKVQNTKHAIQPDLDFDSSSDPIEVINFSPENEYIVNKKEGRRQPPLPPKTKDMIATLSSIGQQRPKKIEYKVQNTKHAIQPEIDTSIKELICTLETILSESQHLEEGDSGNTKVKGDELVEEDIENELGLDMWSTETNFKRAIEEARDSVPEIIKLNQFLVNFVEEQMQRKTPKHLETSQVENEQSQASIDTSETENMPEICMQPQEQNTVTRLEKVARVKSSVDGEKKKQRSCSYCKEAGHYRTRCPKRKLEEASRQGDT